MPGSISPQILFRVMDSLTSLTARDGFLFLEISNEQAEIGNYFLFYFRISFALSFYGCCSPSLGYTSVLSDRNGRGPERPALGCNTPPILP